MSIIPYSAGLKLYDRMPARAKRAVGVMIRPVPRRMMLGAGFRERLRELQASERSSREELERYQVKRLRAVLAHAERSVPYYHDLFRELKFEPEAADLRSLRSLPTLTKDIVRRERGRLTAENILKYRPGEANTTGSTGRPLQFLVDQQTREIELASVWRHYLSNGVSGLDARIASFRGDFVSERDGGALWRWDSRVRELTFNTYAMEEDNIRRMVDRLNRFRPEVIRGYPHSLYVLSKGMEAAGMTLGFAPRLAHTSSEQLPGFMRETIERTLGCGIRDWYSQSEYVVSAGECSEGSYHQTMEAGVVGLAEDDWGMERLIGTGLWNMSMPFINYDVGDHVAMGDECSCGRQHLTFRSLEGRVNDMIITTDGRAISGVGIDNFYEKEVIPLLAGVPEFLRLVQETEGKFTVELFRREGSQDQDLALLEGKFRGLLGSGAEVRVRPLDAFPEQKKWKNVESRLSPSAVSRLLERRTR